MSSELRVDKIIPTAGVPTGGGGGIIQITQSQDGKEQVNFNTSSETDFMTCLLYTSPSPRDRTRSRMPSSA